MSAKGKTQSLEGKVAVITGASRGIGAAVARRLSGAGCSLALIARESSWLRLVVNDIRQRNRSALALEADITDIESVAQIAEDIENEFHRLDIIVNAAGTVWPLDPVAGADAEEWAYNIHSNLIGPFYIVNELLPLMMEQEAGRIINITCRAGQEPLRGESALRASKVGLEMWTRILAMELEHKPIAVACIDPGIVDTGLRSEVMELYPHDEEIDLSAWLPNAQPNDLVSPETAADMIFWLVREWDGSDSGSTFHLGDLVQRVQS